MPPTVELSNEQRACFKAAMRGENIFISGSGGVGKSFVLEAIIKEFHEKGVSCVVTASTGIAALKIGGRTIHSFLGTGICGTADEAANILNTYRSKRARERILDCGVLVIDEISMLSGDYITMMDFWLRSVSGVHEPFAGKQIIFCGDFLQLPPVENKKDKKLKYQYAFDSPSWDTANLKTFDLTRSFRQKDQEFVNALNRIRFGDYNKEVRKIFKPCIGKELDNPTYLVATNAEAHDINFVKLREHPGQEFKAKPLFNIKGVKEEYRDKTKSSLIRDSLTSDPLRIKLGVPVLLLKNTVDYVNGSQGTVVNVSTDSRGGIITIDVKLDDGRVVTVNRELWERKDANGRVTATLRHFPMRLGWALTIHKVQGLTLNNVAVDLQRGFAYGQAYVALSRLQSLDKLALVDSINPQIVKADPRIVEFYDKNRLEQTT